VKYSSTLIELTNASVEKIKIIESRITLSQKKSCRINSFIELSKTLWSLFFNRKKEQNTHKNAIKRGYEYLSRYARDNSYNSITNSIK